MVKPAAQILEYAVPPAKKRRWEWLVLASFSLLVFLIEMLAPRMYPPGWPAEEDYIAMLLLPIGAITMALGTKLPFRFLMYYGFFGSIIILSTEIGYFPFIRSLANPDYARQILINWITFISASTLFCGGTALLRFLPWKKKR